MWKPVPNFYGYEVSDLGEVRSWNPRNGRGVKGSAFEPTILNPTPFKDSKYLRVGMANSTTGKYMTRRVHQLVLESFVGPCPAGHLVMHLDDDPTNNALTNLRYGTPQENLDDMVSKGRSCAGESHPRAIVDDTTRSSIVSLALTKQYYGAALEIADELAVPVNTVRRVVENYNLCARKEGKPIVSFKDRRTRSLALEI